MGIDYKKLALGILLVLVILPYFADASSHVPRPPLRDLKFKDVVRMMNTVVGWFFAVFLIVAVIFVILAAFKYLQGGTNPEMVKEATQMLIYAAIAIAVALLSGSLRFLVERAVINPGSGSSPTVPTAEILRDPDNPGSLPAIPALPFPEI